MLQRFSELRTYLIVVAASALGISSARPSDDIEPGSEPANYWANNGQVAKFHKLDANNKYQAFETLAALANANYKADHATDGSGTNHPHLHMKDDYDSLEDADRYWNKRMGASDAPPKTNQSSSASNGFNCYVLALNHIGKGKYKYWIQGAAADNAMNADSEGVDKAKVQQLDVLYYKSKDHASVVIDVVAVKSGKENEPKQIRYRNNSSGNYDYFNGGWNTPMYDHAVATPGQPINWMGWNTTKLGDVNSLDPADKVRRKK
ncbi:MAG: hypothetical protein L0Y71_16990 [Gemmataceae bacterium]|nr:hypothetical protein [Gemmataceae bacterium]